MSDSTVAIIDRLFQARVHITINGKPVEITVYAAIMYRLFQKDVAGNARAGRVLSKYEDLGRKRSEKESVELEFVDSDYTRSWAGFDPEKSDE